MAKVDNLAVQLGRNLRQYKLSLHATCLFFGQGKSSRRDQVEKAQF